MKKYKSVLNRVRQIEEKYGIKYAKTDGRLFKTLKIIYTFVFAYTLGINLLFVLGRSVYYHGTDAWGEAANEILTVSILSLVLITGFILLCTRLKKSGCIVSVLPLPFLVLTFAQLMNDSVGFLGYKTSFYWRHLVPIAVLVGLAVAMFIIALRSEIKTNRQYKKVVDNLYIQYFPNSSPDGTEKTVTEEQWESFLQNYDPRGYNEKMISE